MDRRRLLWEGGVIVVSILLAFAIDALWDERQTRAEEREILAALRSEYETNVDLVDRVMAAHRRDRADVEKLVGMTEADILVQSQETVSRLMLALCNPWSFDPVLGTTDALIGAGKLEVLRDRELREALTTFKNLTADASEDVGYLGSIAEVLWLEQVALGGPWTDPGAEASTRGEPLAGPDFIPRPTAADLVRVRSDQRYMGLVGRCLLNAGRYVGELENMRTHAARVLDLIGTVGEPTTARVRSR